MLEIHNLDYRKKKIEEFLSKHNLDLFHKKALIMGPQGDALGNFGPFWHAWPILGGLKMGYQHATGVDVDVFTEGFLLYGPTILSLIATPSIGRLDKKVAENFIQNVKDLDSNILEDQELRQTANHLEDVLDNTSIAQMTFERTTFTILESTISYAVGYVAGYIQKHHLT